MMLKSHPTYRYYDVYPKIVRAGRTSTITIRPLHDHVQFTDDQNHNNLYHITWQPVDGPASQAKILNVEPHSGVLRFTVDFMAEGEYVVMLNANRGERSRNFAEFRLYALDDDLFERRPFKGDLHMHSFRSDGRESPAYVAASCRRIGLDFMAVTDHARYSPSLEAIDAFCNIPVDLRIFPGEEVHSPDNPVHIVNFGGSFSVNELFDKPEYRIEIEQIARQIPLLPQGINRQAYASCLWTFNKIRQGGGLGIFCHPYWESLHRYDVPSTLTEILFAHTPFDALELISGYFPEESDSNIFQVARYHEARANGKKIPIVGVSDAHGCERGFLFGWYYTIVFSPTSELSDLVSSIKELYSVAVEELPNQAARSHGPYRLTRYAQFLLKHVFPHHDELCRQEGELMLSYLTGEEGSVEQLSRLMGGTQRLMEYIFGSPHLGHSR